MKNVLLSFLFLVPLLGFAGELPRGTLTFKGAEADRSDKRLDWSYKAIRWGRYQVILATSLKSETKVTVKVAGDEVTATIPAGENHLQNLGTVYVEKHGDTPLRYTPADGAGFDVAYLMLQPAPEGGEVVQAEDGLITLDATSATTHATKMRYEPNPKKNCLGFWIFAEDWASWDFEVKQAGRYQVEVTQGCGGGNGGSDVAVLVGAQTLNFVVEDTGGFQNWKARNIGTVELRPGEARLEIRPKTKKHKAVMDIHKIRLLPVK